MSSHNDSNSVGNYSVKSRDDFEDHQKNEQDQEDNQDNNNANEADDDHEEEEEQQELADKSGEQQQPENQQQQHSEGQYDLEERDDLEENEGDNWGAGQNQDQAIYHVDNEEGGSQNDVDQISSDLEQRLSIIDEMCQDQTIEQILQYRINQLALSNILVFTHGKNQFYLVKAHAQLGVAYLQFNCKEQAIDHLTMALKKNKPLFPDQPESQPYHAFILTELGKCYLKEKSYEDALKLLVKANQLYRTLYGENHKDSIDSLTCMASCYSKTEQYDKAKETIELLYDIQGQHLDSKNPKLPITLSLMADVLFHMNQIKEAIEYQQQAISTLIEIEYPQYEEISQMYETLAVYQGKNDQSTEQVQSLLKAEQILQEIEAPPVPKIIKIKKQIADIFFTNKKLEDALNVLHEVESLETTYFGDSSIEVAKTLRIIGQIVLITSGTFSAFKYLQRAIRIYEENGMKTKAKQIKTKLQMAKNLKFQNQRQKQQQQ